MTDTHTPTTPLPDAEALVEKLKAALSDISNLADRAYGRPHDFTARCGDIAKVALADVRQHTEQAAKVPVADQAGELAQPNSGNMRKCPYPTEIFSEGQIESFLGCLIDDLNPNASYNLSGVHLWQIIDGYRAMLPKQESNEAAQALIVAFDTAVEDGRPLHAIAPNINVLRAAMGGETHAKASTASGDTTPPASVSDEVEYYAVAALKQADEAAAPHRAAAKSQENTAGNDQSMGYAGGGRTLPPGEAAGVDARIIATVLAMRLEHDRDGKWEPWWINFLESAIRTSQPAPPRTTGCGDYICDGCGKRCWFAAPHKCATSQPQKADEHEKALNKAVQCYMEYPPRAEVRLLVAAIIDAYVAALSEAKHEWQPIETAPKDGTPILLWLESYKTSVIGSWFVPPTTDSQCNCCAGWRESGHFHRTMLKAGKMTDSVYTHWMPLPPSPVEPAA